ncbi:major capsid protein [Apilactobacillus xinyiensis]|uniref:major capsid protein n=1 Tax=Apilactobacillus xinyiensis TaxID=2841032 RepID=UPI001C7CDF12|nr:major capsid protein [Apilactobacillus xinyiensis]
MPTNPLTLTDLLSLNNMGAYYEHKVLTEAPYLSENYFPAQKIGSNALKYLQTSVSAPVLANASNYDAQSLPTNRDDFQEQLFSTQFFRDESVLNESDIMEIEQAYANNDDAYLATLIGNLFDDKTKGLSSMRARREWLGMQALMNGKIDMHSNGIHLQLDYGGKQEFQQDATTDWSDAKEANVMKDIRMALDEMRKFGLKPNQIIMNTNTFRWLQSSEKLKSTVPTQNINIANGELFDSQVGDFFAQIFKLNIVCYDGQYQDSDVDDRQHSNQGFHSYIPDGKVVLMNAPLPDAAFLIPTSLARPVVTTGGGMQTVGKMNFAPTPEEYGMRSGKFPAGSVQLFDTGVAFHEYQNDKYYRTEDITSMNVLPSLEGATQIFRMNVTGQSSDNGSAPKTDNSQSNGNSGQTTPPKA